MNFSTLGSLRCICGTDHVEPEFRDRRQVCRACGCEVIAQSTAQYDRALSQSEIRIMTRELRNAAIRASRVELPPSIATLEDLKAYLSTAPASHRRPVSPTQVTPIEQQHIN